MRRLKVRAISSRPGADKVGDTEIEVHGEGPARVCVITAPAEAFASGRVVSMWTRLKEAIPQHPVIILCEGLEFELWEEVADTCPDTSAQTPVSREG